MIVYEIEANPDGTLDVRRDRRGVAYDRDDMDDALRAIRREVARRQDEEIQVVFIEPDGYRRKLTLQGR
jgi:hypothetical protein